MVRRKHPAGPAKSGHDFINNQQRFSPAAPVANGFERAGGPQAHPGRSLDKRLNHHCSSFRDLGRRKSFQRLDIWNLHRRKVPASRPDLEHGRRAKTRRSGCVAMIAILESNKMMLPRVPELPILIGNSQSDLDSRRAVIREKNSAQRVIWEESDDRLREFDGRWVREAEE